MKVAGFTFIRNAVKNDYPVVEAITSILPLCDEFIVALGNSDDGTEKLIEGIGSPKIKVIHTVWDETLREGGAVFAAETDKAFNAISPDSDWAFYIQGDECVHEKYLPVIKQEMEDNLTDERIEGLLFKYLHFYGSYDYYGHSRRWYRREIRVLRNKNGVHSYRDAQGFRIDRRKLNVKLIDAFIYHYGWVKPPAGLKSKLRNFNQFYHDDNWLAENLPETFEFDYKNADRLVPFTGTHPAVMQKRINATNWKLDIDTRTLEKKMPFRRKLLQKIEDTTGWRVSEYKNYNIIK
ncbi:glycosyltransferase family protein [Mucilaginibacter ginsenosidivorans]|uniref:Glycosyltransferase family 2 protein n=1 Tax=Mucilaginibacter ginsenosidivorans TaxID=398053 RepID=A0A5B8US34_9SPHI|nr:glycosyltransferase family 2 protein [Mucilaginibacter ginsenosidivorans]QEC61211.1 glycosyltransferase family 2 protein [Mucilaginibacter ginsenosidivorans]